MFYLCIKLIGIVIHNHLYRKYRVSLHTRGTSYLKAFPIWAMRVTDHSESIYLLILKTKDVNCIINLHCF